MKGKITKALNRSKKTLSKLPYEMVFWDWKEQPDWTEIQEFLLKGFVHLSSPDTGSDQYVLIMTKEKITEIEGDRLYERSMEEIEEGG